MLSYDNGRMFLALWNSTVLTVSSIVLIIVLAALVAYVMQRRADRTANIVSSIMFAGLVIPPSVVPTIFLLQWLGIYKTMLGLILVEVAFTLPFATMIFRAFVASIPREIDEAAIIDGASPLQVFFRIILPLIKPAVITVIVTSAVSIYNDFASPLYFLPGASHVTAQLTLFNFISQFNSQWNLLFANVIVITIPPADHVYILSKANCLRDDDRRGEVKTESENEKNCGKLWNKKRSLIRTTRPQDRVEVVIEHARNGFGVGTGGNRAFRGSSIRSAEAGCNPDMR